MYTNKMFDIMKRLFKMIFAATFMMITGYNVCTSQRTVALSDLALASVEALAFYETDNECSGCIRALGICKDWDWGGCLGHPYIHNA